MSHQLKGRSLILALAATLALPATAAADYLYSVFREACSVDTTIRYSGADPIVATVHIEKTEVDRIASNYLTWGGFTLPSSGYFRTTTLSNNNSSRELVNAQGHLYALRLFKEKTPNSNQWEFSAYNNNTVVDVCDMDDGTFDGNKTCLFDAGQMLTNRDKRNSPRKIYTGRIGSPLSPSSGNDGAYTLPITATEALTLSGIPTQDPTDWSSTSVIGNAILENWLGNREAVTAFRSLWDTYKGRNRINEAMNDLPAKLPATLDTPAEMLNPTNLQLAKALKWLHGEGNLRDWDLGDVYHASAAVVEAPERYYLDRGYPQFKEKFKKRPEMIYVGANDGMIHAFHAGPDIYYQDDGCSSPRWKPGEEEWAYLPANMMAKTLVAVERGDQRFFSQDLSCRFTDVQVNTDITTCDNSSFKWPWQSGGDKPYCGWRTLLVCGQGWGGSWYVGLDVTDPMGPFRNDNGTAACSRTNRSLPVRAQWEFTYLPTATSSIALGKSWSLPSIGLVNYSTTPKWLATFGSGYNTDMQNCPKYSGGSCSNETGITHTTHKSFRLLNLDYDGKYPYHGDGIGEGPEGAYAWVMDLADGSILKTFQLTGQGAVVADIPAVDSDFNGLIDAAYVAGWNGNLARIHFGDKSSSSTSIGLNTSCSVSTMAGQRKLASHPTAFGIPPRGGITAGTIDNRVMTVLGSGVNSGDDPDQQRNNGNFWDIDARVFADDGSSSCPSTSSILCGANSWWTVNDNDGSQKPRLLGAPIFSRQSNGDDWLVYTTWSPPGDQCAKEGIARLWCLDVTNPAACKECQGFTAQGKSYNIVLYSGEQPPSSPVSADGNIYVAGEDGPIKQGITNSAGQGPNANSFAPVTAVPARVTSWREVF